MRLAVCSDASRATTIRSVVLGAQGRLLRRRGGRGVGIIGRNGAGKSTLLKVLTRITTPTEGRAEIRGRVGSLLEVGTGFHPELTGRENVFLNGSILGMRRREINAEASRHRRVRRDREVHGHAR